MDKQILSILSAITHEEQQILDGRTKIDRSLYMDGSRDMITGKKLLSAGKQIAVRPHTRFIHFPEHTHDYVEMVYMCRGSTRHRINGTELTLQQGELLLLGQNARQEIYPAGREDIAVNFIVRPEFFSGTLDFLGNEETPLREFLVKALCGENPAGYLHFQVADVKTVQNLMENLLWTLISETQNRRSIHQLTMGLLFVQLLNHTDRLSASTPEQEMTVKVLRYIEENYVSGSLTEIAGQLHYDTAWLCREIHRRTGKTYTQLVQQKRLSQAAWLLKNTRQKVADIALSVGYENISYFHRIFTARYGQSPRQFRLANQDTF